MLSKIQNLLHEVNLYNGVIDGKIGLETLRALQKMDKDAATKMQSLLKQGGYYTGECDGMFGPKSYQAFNSLIPAPVLTASALQKIFPNANSRFLEYINKYAKAYGVTTKAQMCAFLANVLVESSGFNAKDLRENLNYSSERLYTIFRKYVVSKEDARKLVQQGPEAIANRVYGGRMGNGRDNGDGWRFRGGGLIQTTGRYNYSMLSKAINEDLINFPNRISEPEIATKAALYYWQSNYCGLYADRMELTKCRESVNGGRHGLKEVNDYFLKAWAYLF